MYAASKGAVVTMTRALAVDLAPAIRVNCVCPLAAATRFQEGLSTDPEEVAARLARTRAAGASVPMKRIAEAEDVADALPMTSNATCNGSNPRSCGSSSLAQDRFSKPRAST
jgi:NAD(P)-dependent dehydrogenase (short-subunit alcohol dehydrogenase family)